MPSQLPWALWAFAAGAGIPVMAITNAALARSLGSTSAAAVILFAVGLTVSTLFLAATRGLAVLTLVTSSPMHFFVGGLIVAFYINSATYLAPRFGVANTILFVMVAQIITSSLIDHFGAFGAAVRPLDTKRIIGLLVLMVGLALTQMPRTSS